MEVIIATAFGRAINFQRGQSTELTEAATDFIAGGQEDQNTSALFLVMLLSTYLSKIVQFYNACLPTYVYIVA